MMQPPPSSSPLSHSIKFPPSKLLSHPLFPRKPLHRRLLAKPASPSAPLAGGDTSATATADAALLSLLRSRDTDAAFAAYSRLTHLPGPVPLSRLLSQLSYQNTPAALARAQSLLRRVRDARELRRLDANSLGLLAVTAARHGAAPYALSVLRSMLRSGYLPHVKAWSAVAARLGSAPDDGPMEALRLFDSVIHRIRSAGAVASDARPDAAAFNAVLNACANIGDIPRFRQILEEMPEFNATPDVLTFNIMIKLCARSNRKDLLVSTLELIIFRGLVPCITTFHSLVAAYVGFSDLDTAEKLVQAMRESRNDICAVLRDCNGDSTIVQPDNGTEAHDILENLVNYNHRNNPPPLLPKTHTPDCRMYTTLMKGYLKEGRSDDVVRMIRAMQREADPASHPDHVTYTTVITALVKAGAMDRAHRVLAEMDQAGVPANRITYNVLLKGYCHQLQIGKAKELIRDMAVDKGIEPNVVSYNILIDGCILVDDSAGALAFFNEMRERGIAPSKVSYTTLMKAFALSGQPRLAHKVFDEMGKDPRVKVDRAAWNMLIEGYCRLGLVEEAKKVVERMKEDGFQPDIATYGSLANGIALARKPGEALLLWNEVKERCTASPPLKPDEGLLDALADVCVRAAFFRKALEIVACMEEFGISPNKTKYKRIYVEMHSRMFTSKHASQARQMRRTERKRAAEAFKFWLGLPNSYYGSEWRLEPVEGGD